MSMCSCRCKYRRLEESSSCSSFCHPTPAPVQPASLIDYFVSDQSVAPALNCTYFKETYIGSDRASDWLHLKGDNVTGMQDKGCINLCSDSEICTSPYTIQFLMTQD